MMKIASISISNYGGGSITVQSDTVTANVQLSDADVQQFTYLAERIYEQHQQKIAEEFARPLPALAHFTEVIDG